MKIEIDITTDNIVEQIADKMMGLGTIDRRDPGRDAQERPGAEVAP